MTIDTVGSTNRQLIERFDLMESKSKELNNGIDSLQEKISFVQSRCIELEEQLHLNNVASLQNREDSRRIGVELGCLKELLNHRVRKIERSMWLFVAIGHGFGLVLNKSAAFLVHIRTQTVAAVVFFNQRRKICVRNMSDNQKLFFQCVAITVGAVVFKIAVKCALKYATK